MGEMKKPPGNDEVAEIFERIADLLEAQNASGYRIRAYRTGARTIRELEEPIAQRADSEGADALESLPGIGDSLAALIREIVAGGGARLLERLEGQMSPADLFATVPGIGEELAERIERELKIENLEDLEAAAHDGRLDALPGFGPRRVRGVQESLGHLLRHASARRARSSPPKRGAEQPSVAALLEVDHRYLEQARSGELPTIAPRRFNPERRAWLPILHTEVEGWSLTAMFSNTARAHQLGRTDDWVVVYYERDGIDGQCTVVTEHSGALESKRVVRGREEECARYHGLTRSPKSARAASTQARNP